MEPKDYLDYYTIPLGAKVVIKECHSQPAIEGKTAHVMAWMSQEHSKYPLMIHLEEPVYIHIPGMPLAYPFEGPHYCRPDELTVLGVTEIPDVFKDMEGE